MSKGDTTFRENTVRWREIFVPINCGGSISR